MSGERQVKSEIRNQKSEAVDARHHPLMCEIDAQYRHANGGLPMPSPGRAAKSLSDFLAENPKWPVDRLASCVIYRFKSRGVNLSSPAHTWIHTLPNYALGPLDEWGKPIQKAEGRRQKAEIRNTEEEIARYWKRKNSEL